MMAQLQEDKIDFAPKKFNMWIFIFTSFMLFAAFTSGFIVYVGGKSHALNIILPHSLLYSTIVIVTSSITLFVAARSLKRLMFQRQKLFLWCTFALGLVFFVLQFYACSVLVNMNVFFTGNPNAAQSFIYVLVVIHLVHILAAILLLLNTIKGTYRNLSQARSQYNMEMTSIFWHFLGIIWIYLYVFLLLNQY